METGRNHGVSKQQVINKLKYKQKEVAGISTDFTWTANESAGPETEVDAIWYPPLKRPHYCSRL